VKATVKRLQLIALLAGTAFTAFCICILIKILVCGKVVLEEPCQPLLCAEIVALLIVLSISLWVLTDQLKNAWQQVKK